MISINIKVDSKNKIPFCEQIANQIIILIAKGELTGKLPIIKDLSEACKVSYSTILDAYNILERDGYVNIGRGKKRTEVCVYRDEKTDIKKAEASLESILARYKLKDYSREDLNNIIDRCWNEFKN